MHSGDHVRVKASAFEGLIPLLLELGGDRSTVLASAGVDETSLDDPESWLPYSCFLSALHLAAQNTRTPEFGLHLARFQNLSMLGALGYALREAPDVGAVIENLNRYLPLHSEGTQTSLALHKDTAYWSCELLAPDTSGMYQQYDLIVGLAVKFLRQLVDPTWAPTNAYLRHAVPADRKPYLNALHCPVTFNADVTAITFPSVLLKRRIPAADCHLYRVLSSYLVQQDSYRPADFSARVRETIAFSLHQVDGSIETVAKHLGMLPRTLQRRLRDSGLSYTSLINDVRRNLSQQYLRDTTMSMTQIATTLGFSESAAFSRWFRREFGVAPRWWRQAIMT